MMGIEGFTDSGYFNVELGLKQQAAMGEIIRCASEFFTNSTEKHKALYATQVGEGYRPFAFEYTDSPDQPDLVECFSCSLPRSSIKSSFPEGCGLKLYETLLESHKMFSDLSERIASDLFSYLRIGPIPQSFRFGFLEWSRLQVNYGLTERATRELLHVVHEDGNFLTIAFSTAPGLELVLSNGSTRDLWQPRTDQISILAGEILTAATNGKVRTGFHQVRRRPEVGERFAVLYFADPNPLFLESLGIPLSAQEIFDLITQGWLRSGLTPVQTHLTS